MTADEFQTIRTVLAFRLQGLPVSYIAHQVGIPAKAVQHILIDFGNVERRTNRYLWSRSFAITEEMHRRFKMPAYVPLSVERGNLHSFPTSTLWAAITRDAIVVAVGDGKGILGIDGVAEGFYPEQGGPTSGD